MVDRPDLEAMAALRRGIGGALRVRSRVHGATATGRVLDLGGWLDREDFDATEVVTVDSPVALGHLGGEKFDSIVSIIRTPLVGDLDAWLVELRGLLVSDGKLLMLEPVGRSGATGRLLAATGRMWMRRSGLHLDRDLPAKLRAVGLSVAAIDRFEVASLSAPMRPFVDLRARHNPLVSSPGS